MQRRIVAGVIALLLVLGGLGFGLWTYKQNRPYPVWIAMPVNPELPTENREKLVKELKNRLEEGASLARVSKDLALANTWALKSDDEAVAELKKRLIVNSSEGNLGKGKPPTINVGIRGKNKEKELSGKIASRLMEEAFKILGIEKPKS